MLKICDLRVWFPRTVGVALCALWLSPTSLAQDAGPEQDAVETTPANVADESQAEAPVFVEATANDGQRRTVSSVRIQYMIDDEIGRPDVESVLNTWVTLARAEDGWVAPRAGEPTQLLNLTDLPNRPAPEQTFYDSALATLAPALVQRLQALGFIGVYVEPDPNELRVVDGVIVDDRPAGDTGVTMQITMGVVVDVRTNALGDRVTTPPTLNNPVHDRIRLGSPVRPHDPEVELAEDQSSLLRRDLIDRYTNFLNRHPGRRVDIAVVPEGSEFGGVSVDYLVTENKPWLIFFQFGNTGSKDTEEYQERFGFIHNQLTDNDDILSIDYLTGGFDELHAVTGSYERPVNENGRLRGRVYGSWYTYEAGDLGQTFIDYSGDGYTAGAELRWNFHQDDDLFIDLIGGTRWDRAKVDNDTLAEEGEGDFLLPYVGLRLEQFRRTRRTSAGVAVEFNVLGNSETDLTALGRFDADDRWTTMYYDASHSFYLEPLLTKDKDKPTPLAHELAFNTRGQWAFDKRLTPTFQEVAGGMFTVRGYEQAIVAGDSVFLGTAEYRYHVPQGLAPRAEPTRLFGSPFRTSPQYVSGPTDWDFIVKGFVDVARVLQSDRRSFETHNTLVGAGVGLELVYSNRFRGQVDFGWALTTVEDAAGNDEADAGDFEVHFLLTATF